MSKMPRSFLAFLLVALAVILPVVPAAALNSNGAPAGSDPAQLQHILLLLLALLMVVFALRLPASTAHSRLLSVFVHLWLAASLVLVVAIDEGALEILAPSAGSAAMSSVAGGPVSMDLVTSSKRLLVPTDHADSAVYANSDPLAAPKHSREVLQGAACGTIAPMDAEPAVSRPYVGFSQ